jgi:hypothetical protein
MTDNSDKSICGLVMPISAIDGMSESHWSEVYTIITEAIERAGFIPNLVSHAEDTGIIQQRIIQNLYNNPIVVCDVSGKNPNVMFELGLRLAFDKPTVIVKDDKTSYSFDTAPIEHVGYPRDLRYQQISEFKEKLSEKIKATHCKASSDPNYTTFLKHFGEFTIAKLDKKEVSGQEYMIEGFRAIRHEIGMLRRLLPQSTRSQPDVMNILVPNGDESDLIDRLQNLVEESQISAFGWTSSEEGTYLRISYDELPPYRREELRGRVQILMEEYMAGRKATYSPRSAQQ